MMCVQDLKNWLKIDIFSKISACQANLHPKLKFVNIKVLSLLFNGSQFLLHKWHFYRPGAYSVNSGKLSQQKFPCILANSTRDILASVVSTAGN